MNMITRALVFAFTGLLLSGTVLAEANTWLATPVDNNWNNPANWSQHVLPNIGRSGEFSHSTVTSVEVSDFSAAGTIIFSPGASAYTITYTFTDQTDPTYFFYEGGDGIDNQSGITQKFILHAPVNAHGDGAALLFYDGSAGDMTDFTCEASPIPGGYPSGIAFELRASAGSAVIHNQGGLVAGESGGSTSFLFTGTSAENATIINEGSTVQGAFGGSTHFEADHPTAGNATLIANSGSNGGGGGSIVFEPDAFGGTARCELFGNGYLDLSLERNSTFATGSDLLAHTQGTVRRGASVTLINNTALTPIDGTFTNLTDGSTITVGGVAYLANYEGGDGNDLTLTVQ